MSTQQLASLVKRLEAVASKLEATASGAGAAPVEAGEEVKAYDDYYAASVEPWLKLSRQIGGDLDGCTDLVEQAFAEVRKVIDVASKSKKPDNETYGKLLQPLVAVIKKVGDYCFKFNRGPMGNHLRGLSDGIKLVQWVAVPNTPVPFVKDMVEAARFYHIKVLVEYKKKEEKEAKLHKSWVEQWAQAGNDLAAYVKKYHTTGLKWNPKGSSSLSTASATPKKAAPKKKVVAKKSGAGAKAGLFDAINKGGNVTSGLKHVKKSQKVKYQTAPKPKVKFSSKAKKAKRITKDPVLELQRGSKWVVENFDGNKKVEVVAESFKNTCYIYKCDNSNIIVKGKMNSITLDNCQKTNLIFESLVAVCDVVNCKSVKIQILGTVPTVQVDKTDGFNVFLNEKTMHTTLVSSKSSEMNVSIPVGTEGDYKEFPVPEQYVTSYKDGKFSTVTSGHF